MKISHRLYLTIVPALLGVLLMAALLYWGQHERGAPLVVFVVGGITVLISLGLTWANAAFVARRIDELVGVVSPSGSGEAPDELEQIARGVDRLSTEAETALANIASGERTLQDRARGYATTLSRLADETAQRLEDIRLPLHILLENRFGDLNENQEEMLGAARAAAEAADAEIVSLKLIAQLDLGTQHLRRDRMKPSDIFDALRPMLVASAESAGAAIELAVAPLLPAIIGDRARLQDALSTLLGDALRAETSGTRVELNVEQDATNLVVRLSGPGPALSSVRAFAATRVIEAHGGRVEKDAEGMTIVLPLEIRGRASARS